MDKQKVDIVAKWGNAFLKAQEKGKKLYIPLWTDFEKKVPRSF